MKAVREQERAGILEPDLVRRVLGCEESELLPTMRRSSTPSCDARNLRDRKGGVSDPSSTKRFVGCGLGSGLNMKCRLGLQFLIAAFERLIVYNITARERRKRDSRWRSQSARDWNAFDGRSSAWRRVDVGGGGAGDADVSRRGECVNESRTGHGSRKMEDLGSSAHQLLPSLPRRHHFRATSRDTRRSYAPCDLQSRPSEALII